MRRRPHGTTLAVAAALLVVAAPIYGQGMRPQLLHPKTYASPSGTYRLTVDPGPRHGEGKAHYRLTHQGRDVWTGERPFTLWQASVTDEGVVGGYAYSHGVEGMRGPGEFRVVMLDRQGTARLEHVTPRQPTRVLHGFPCPIAAELILDPANDRMLVQVNDTDDAVEPWWVFRLSTAKLEAMIAPRSRMKDPDSVRGLINARPISGTPLTLLHHWLATGPFFTAKIGARFTLIDLQGEPVWTLDLPADYSRPDDEKAEDRIRVQIRESGAILRADQPGRFELRFVADAQRVAFAVERNAAGAWAVREVSRQPDAPAAAPKVAVLDGPEKQPQHAGIVRLRAPRQKPAGAVRDIEEFVIDGRGRLAFLRRENTPDALSFVLVESTGTLVREVHFAKLAHQPETLYRAQLAWCGGDRFLLTRSPSVREAKASAWWIDAATGRTESVPGFDCPSIDRLAGFPHGRFVALATRRFQHTQTTTVHLFDARGHSAGELPAYPSDAPGALFSPKDVAVTRDGAIAVLEGVGGKLRLFDATGRHLRTIELEAAWKRKPSYLSHLAADAGGGVIVGDFHGQPPIVRMAADGAVRGELTAKFADGRTSSTLQEVRADPDGRLWATDRDALLRLDANGVVDRVIGEPPDPDQLGAIAAMHVDGRGLIYTVAERSAAVHVFDSTGRHLRVCRPDPTDFELKVILPTLTVNEAGEVYVSDSDHTAEYLRFAADGRRIGFVKLGLDKIHEEWHFRPGGAARWVIGFETILLVNDQGNVVRTIERRPDGNWLVHPSGGVVGADGSLAIMTDDSTATGLHLYDQDGRPLRTSPLPPSIRTYRTFGYDGQRIAVADDTRIWLLDATGRAIQQFRPPARNGGEGWQPFLVPSQRQLWLFDGRDAIHKYDLP